MFNSIASSHTLTGAFAGGFYDRGGVLRRMETRSRDAIDAELRKSEERLFMLTSHIDRHQANGTLF